MRCSGSKQNILPNFLKLFSKSTSIFFGKISMLFGGILNDFMPKIFPEFYTKICPEPHRRKLQTHG
jgi:hypothetical protein